MNVSQLVLQQSGSRAAKDRASFHVAACMTAFGIIVSRMSALSHVCITIETGEDAVTIPLTVPAKESFGRISQRVRTATRGKLPLFINSYVLSADGFVMLCEQGPSGKWYFSVQAPAAYDQTQAYFVKTSFLELIEKGLRNPVKPLHRLQRDATAQGSAFFRYISTLE